MSHSPTPVYQFDGHTVRPMTEQDRAYLEMKIQADKYHRGRMDADFFLNLLPGESAWALEDREGRVVFYFKNTPCIRMSIQFTGDIDLKDKRRNMSGLIRGLAWIEAIFRTSRFREILFDTEGPELKQFAKSRLGFVETRNLLSRIIAPYNTQESHERTVGTVPTSELERAGEANVRT